MIKYSAIDTRQRGTVMIFVLLSVVLIGGILAITLNVGREVEKSIHTQNTADATAMAGSVTVARDFNTVAYNNIAISRYLAAVNVMDAVPMATRFTRTEQEAFVESLNTQLSGGTLISTNSTINALATQEFLDFLIELQEELDLIIPVDDAFQNVEMENVTHYQPPSGQRGALWRAMSALSDMSASTLERIGETAQHQAIIGSQQNIGEDTSTNMGVLLPYDPDVPYRRGAFVDFERPVRHGMLPPEIDDAVDRRGPYDTVFGWRTLQTRRTGGEWVPGTRRVSGGGRGNTPISGGTGGGGGGSWVGGETEVIGYRTYGTHQWLKHIVGRFTSSHVENTRLNRWISILADAKLRYLWEEGETQQVVEPDWITSFSEATAIGDSGSPEIKETAFFILEYKSSQPVSSGSFFSEGTYAKEHRNNDQNPRITRRSGWMDPRTWGVPQVGSFVWLDQWEYTVFFDESIGLSPIYDSDGNMVEQTVYRIDVFVFAGVNIGEEIDIPNPYEGFNRFDNDAPAPYNLNHAIIDRSIASNQQYLTHLGVVRHNDKPVLMSNAFDGGKAFSHIVKIAQSRVFNNHSWDLWTPMWHARMEPVTNYAFWIEQAAQISTYPAINAGGTASTVELQEIQEYLNSTRDLGENNIRH